MAEILRVLKRRVRSVKNTMQMTRAMSMVAAAKLRRTQAIRDASRPYAEKLRALLARVAESLSDEFAHPLFTMREEKRILLVVFTGDRGLCGAFNANIIREAEQFLARWGKDGAELCCVGRKGRDYFRKRGWNVTKEVVNLRGRVNLDAARDIAAEARARFERAEVDAVYLCYNALVTAMTYRERIEKFLPLDPAAMGLGKDEGAVSRGVEYIFEPSRKEVFEQLLPRYCESRLYETMAEALTAEHSARMISMNNASNNCEDLIDSLTLRMNKARQASITKEILDIVGGAEAVKG